jgi:hypothetical protein
MLVTDRCSLLFGGAGHRAGHSDTTQPGLIRRGRRGPGLGYPSGYVCAPDISFSLVGWLTQVEVGLLLLIAPNAVRQSV